MIKLTLPLIVTMAILFWGAKKRQWAVAATMRRSMKRVTTGLKAMTPRTPHKMTFSPIEKSRNRKDSFGGGAALLHKKNPNPATSQLERSEKGSTPSESSSSYTATVTANGGKAEAGGNGNGKKSRPVPPRVQVPQSRFEMESPKTPMCEFPVL
jgi:hypothetical protein